MPEWFSGLFGDGGWFTKGENLKGVGSILGGAGQAYGALAQDKAARQMLSMQKDQNAEENKRRAKTQLVLDGSFNNLTPMPTLPLGGG